MRRDAGSFVLLPEDGDHSETFAPSAGLPPAVSPPLPDGGVWGRLPPPIEDFIGREVELETLVQLLCSRRFVGLVGPSGIGKSALLVEAGRFLHLRRQEPFDEVRWLGGVGKQQHVGNHDVLLGLQELYDRLKAVPRRRVLLLLDDMAAFGLSELWPLLQFEGVHISFSVTDGATADSLLQAEDAAQELGLKPLRFSLGPLEGFAQARLLLLRVQRPLFKGEILGWAGPGAPDAPHGILRMEGSTWQAAELAALANGPLLREVGGSPRRILAAARGLLQNPPKGHTLAPSEA